MAEGGDDWDEEEAEEGEDEQDAADGAEGRQRRSGGGMDFEPDIITDPAGKGILVRVLCMYMREWRSALTHFADVG